MSVSFSSLDEESLSMSATSYSPHAPLIASTSSDSALPLSTAYRIDVAQPCPLLDTPPPIRSLMLDYMDDRTAIRYLKTCCTLHSGYHAYPVKQAMSVATFTEVTQLDVYFDRERRRRRAWKFFSFAVLCAQLVSFIKEQMALLRVLLYVYAALIAVDVGLYTWLHVSRRVDCCKKGWWGMWRQRYIMPRVQRLSDELSDLRLLPHLQHLTELTTTYKSNWLLGTKSRLPRSLRTLHLLDSPSLTLEPDTLPPHLTSLSLAAVRNKALPVGVLPQSLTSLQLTFGFNTEAPIGVGVLPASLQRLQLDEWRQPLSHLAMPALLTDLSIQYLCDYPLPALPPQLQVLAVGGAFSQPLTGVLPASLRVLRLTGAFDQPLTADMFACTPQLEELWLSDRSPARQLAADVLPRSLRVLRLGKRSSLPMRNSSKTPPALRQLLLPAEWPAERVRRFEHFGETRGIAVVQEAARGGQVQPR